MTAAEARILTPCLTFQLAEQREWCRLWDALIDVREAFSDCLTACAVTPFGPAREELDDA